MAAAAAVKTQPTLVERFKAAHAEMVKLGDELIQSHVDYLKLCHADLPRVDAGDGSLQA